jgi:uncharacterized protein (TIGR02453 family)
MITRETFRFLDELKRHNQREWFNANKPRYEEHVKEALDDFVERAAVLVKKVSPRLNGGVMRIYRDTRFSKDKSPYKTHMGLHFTLGMRSHPGKDWEAPGYYFHVEPRNTFFAAGMWHPEPPAAKQIRTAIAARSSEWRKVTRGLSMEGEKLARPPRGFEGDPSLMEELKRKDFCAVEKVSEKLVIASDFPKRFAALCKRTAPLMKFLAKAVGASF